MGRKDEAVQEYSVFLDAWADADPGLIEVIDAEKRLKAVKSQL